MGFICSGYAEFECISQLLRWRLLPCSWRSGTLPDPLGHRLPGLSPHAWPQVRLGAGCRLTAHWADICFPPTAPQVVGPSAPLSHGTSMSLGRELGALSAPSRDPRHQLWHGESSRCCCIVCWAAYPLPRIFISSLLVVYLPQYLWGWAPEQGTQFARGCRCSGPSLAVHVVGFVPHRPLLNPLPTLLTRELLLLPAAFGKAGGPPLLLAVLWEDGPCQAALTV